MKLLCEKVTSRRGLRLVNCTAVPNSYAGNRRDLLGSLADEN